MKAKLAGVVLGGFFVAMALPLLAHHPFPAEYDWKKPMTVTGTVTKFDWMNPHAVLHLDAKDSSGKMESWTFEMGSLTALTRLGWNKNTVKNGDQVTVDAWAAKDGSKRASAKSIKLAGGKELWAGSSFFDSATQAPKKPRATE